jgi:uncharacterized Zn-finger protein
MSVTYQHPDTISDTGFSVTETGGFEAACDGGGGALGHPRVYLHIDPREGGITCPYCSRRFVHAPHLAHEHR